MYRHTTARLREFLRMFALWCGCSWTMWLKSHVKCAIYNVSLSLVCIVQADSVWTIDVNILKFAEPPEILGR